MARARHQENPERMRVKDRKRCEDPQFRAKKYASVDRWRKANPAWDIINSSRRMARLFDYVPIGYGLNESEATALVNYWISRKPTVCEFCGCQRKLVLDHNHKTGKVRAWLCSPCNALEGHITTGRVARLCAFIASRDE